MARVFKMTGRDGKRLANWYGKVKVAPTHRRRVKLYTDKIASEKRLRELQIEADRAASGVTNADTGRLLPVFTTVQSRTATQITSASLAGSPTS